MALADQIHDFQVRHQVGLHRLGTGVVKKIVALLNRVDADLVQRLLKHDFTAVSAETWSKLRLEKMLEAIRVINRDAYRIIGKTLTDELVGLAKYEADFQKRMISSALPVEWDIVTPAAAQLRAVVTTRPFQGALLRDWVRGLERGRYGRLKVAVQIGFTEGQTIDEIVRRVRGTKAASYRDGILDISRRSAEAMVRTAVNHTATAARDVMFQENDDLIQGVQWVSTLDSRTTPICQERDGKVFPIDSGPRPPAHIGCRSTIIPVVKSWRQLGIDIDEAPEGTRASMNGQVAADVTYGQWLRRQPVEVQNEALGVTKAMLFRNGGLTVDRFVDKSGRAYTLDELRDRETAAFDKAGLAA